MVNEQGSLFGQEVQASASAPRICALCGDPVGWMPRAGRWGEYCGGKLCINIYRLCKKCGKRYHRDQGGSRYCSTDCRDQWHYGRVRPPRRGSVGVCSYCGADRFGANAWDLCAEHWELLTSAAHRLRIHHVPLTMVHRLLADPTCFNPRCDIDILKRHRNESTGRYRAEISVDHDHRHCPGQLSCGLCVRGLLCSRCNIAAGLLLDDPGRAHGLGEYLQATAFSSESENEALINRSINFSQERRVPSANVGMSP